MRKIAKIIISMLLPFMSVGCKQEPVVSTTSNTVSSLSNLNSSSSISKIQSKVNFITEKSKGDYSTISEVNYTLGTKKAVETKKQNKKMRNNDDETGVEGVLADPFKGTKEIDLFDGLNYFYKDNSTAEFLPKGDKKITVTKAYSLTFEIENETQMLYQYFGLGTVQCVVTNMFDSVVTLTNGDKYMSFCLEGTYKCHSGLFCAKDFGNPNYILDLPEIRGDVNLSDIEIGETLKGHFDDGNRGTLTNEEFFEINIEDSYKINAGSFKISNESYALKWDDYQNSLKGIAGVLTDDEVEKANNDAEEKYKKLFDKNIISYTVQNSGDNGDDVVGETCTNMSDAKDFKDYTATELIQMVINCYKNAYDNTFKISDTYYVMRNGVSYLYSNDVYLNPCDIKVEDNQIKLNIHLEDKYKETIVVNEETGATETVERCYAIYLEVVLG